MPIPSDNADIWYIRGLRLHERVPESVIRSLQAEGKLERWGHRAEITRRDNGVLSVVLSGALDARDPSNGRAIRLKAGDLFGETGNGAQSVTLSAYDDTVVCTLSRDGFEGVADGHLGEFMTKVGLRNRRSVNVSVKDLLYLPPLSRVAKVLVRLVDELGSKTDVLGSLPISLKARHLAELTGLSVEDSRLALEALKGSELVRIGRNEIVLPDFDLIERLAATAQ